jgi:hypothetical protein
MLYIYFPVKKACRVAVAYAVLHNITNMRNVPLPPAHQDMNIIQDQPQDHPVHGNERVVAQRVRQQFITQHFI